ADRRRLRVRERRRSRAGVVAVRHGRNGCAGQPASPERKSGARPRARTRRSRAAPQGDGGARPERGRVNAADDIARWLAFARRAMRAVMAKWISAKVRREKLPAAADTERRDEAQRADEEAGRDAA